MLNIDRLRMFGNRVLSTEQEGRKEGRKEGTAGWRKLHNDEHRNF
jgi:hypothetical protein